MLTHARLLDVLSYDKETGKFIWLKSTGPRCKIGSEAGFNHETKGTFYRVIKIDGKPYQASRLAWFYVKGVWPPAEIDHHNGCEWDDRFLNLRPATHKQNAANRGVRCDNKLGQKGVNYRNSKYEVNCNGKWVGAFSTIEEAKVAYNVAAEIAYGEFARRHEDA